MPRGEGGPRQGGYGGGRFNNGGGPRGGFGQGGGELIKTKMKSQFKVN